MTKPITRYEWQRHVAEAFSGAVQSTYEDLIKEAVKAERKACAERAWIALVKNKQPWNIRQDVTEAILSESNDD